MLFPFLLFIISVGTVEGGSCRTRDDQALLQFARGHAAKKNDCSTPVPWPCDNEDLASFPIQLINRNGPGRGSFEQLNLTDGTYSPLCNIVGTRLNACGISPADNSVYCITRDGNIDPDFFVRISCDLSNWEQGDPPVDGFLCWFGPVNNSFAGAFDEDGNYFFKTNDEGNGNIREITATDIAGFTVFDTPAAANTSNQVFDASNFVLQNPPLNPLADFNILKIDLGPTFFNGVGEQEYLIGCHNDEVRVQCLTCPDVEENPGDFFTTCLGNPQKVEDLQICPLYIVRKQSATDGTYIWI